MDLIQAAVLAIMQGITEFLPISSSGHLILVPKLLGWPDQGLAFDVAVHLGSLIAVLGYFRQDICRIITAVLGRLGGDEASPDSRLGFAIALASIPVGLAGFILNDWIGLNLRSAMMVGLASIVFGVLLWRIDRRGPSQRNLDGLTAKDIAVVGCAQALALIPGVSRSGMTIMAGRFMGLQRESAARFSFLLAIPVIIMASGLKAFELARSAEVIDWALLAFAMLISALVAYACIHWFLNFIKRFSMAPFAFYLMAMGVIILSVFW